MIVPKQTIWSAGDEPDADLLNKNVRDTLNFLLDPPEVIVEQLTQQSLTTNTWTRQSFQAIRKNNDGMASGTNIVHIRCQTSGWYEIMYTGAWTANADGTSNRQIVALRKNGGGMLGRSEGGILPSFARAIGGNMYPIYLNKNDIIELYLYHTGTTRTSVTSSPEVRTSLRAKWVSK